MFSGRSGFLTQLPLLLSGIKMISFLFHILGIVHCPPFPDLVLLWLLLFVCFVSFCFHFILFFCNTSASWEEIYSSYLCSAFPELSVKSTTIPPFRPNWASPTELWIRDFKLMKGFRWWGWWEWYASLHSLNVTLFWTCFPGFPLYFIYPGSMGRILMREVMWKKTYIFCTWA